MNTLKIGMRGPEVERWQAFLIKAGFLSGGADGSFGPATYDATVKFQQSKGLTPDGVAGPRTLSYLTAETGVTEPPPQDQTLVVLTETLLKQIMPGLRPADCTAYLPFLQQAMVEFGISTRARAAAFLAQLAHESGQFKWMEEIWGPTAQQQRYEPTTRKSQDLGNTQAGDGKRFKGRGPIQLTGRTNYGIYGGRLGLDLVANPDLARTKEVGFRTAGLYWKMNGLNELADKQAFRAITQIINGGFNGLEDRTAFYERAKKALGVPTVRSIPDQGPVRLVPHFSRGLDTPGEITPTASERNPESARSKAKQSTAKKSTVKKSTRPAKKVATKAAKKAAKKPTKNAASKPTKKAAKKVAKKPAKSRKTAKKR